MLTTKTIVVFFLIFLLAFNIFAQKSDDAAKIDRATKLLEQILGDAQNLRLPENRALVFARVGSAYWTTNEKLARKLFQDSISDLMIAQTEAENEKSGKQYFQALIYGQAPRLDVINLIAARDAELALELLAKTRPARITQALTDLSGESLTTARQFADNEIINEQRLIALAAEQDPQRAIKRIRESLKNGATYETLNLLRKIYAKDAETANQLAVEVVEDFLKKDLSKKQQTAEMMGYFVSEFGREKTPDEKSLSVPAALTRELALKLIGHWLAPQTTQFYGYWNCYPVIEKMFPTLFAQVKQKQEKISRQYQTEESLEYSKLTEGETAPEELVARAEKFSSSYRNELYRMAADKYVQSGNLAQAERIISTNISGDDSERYLSQFYTGLANQAAAQGKFEAAQGFAEQIPDENQRVTSLIYLAKQIFQKDPKENRQAALAFLQQARAIVPDPPENQYDFNGALLLAAAYAEIDANESFRLIESLIAPLNELVQANFVLAKFRNYGGYRQGELQMSGVNYLGVYNLENVLRNLKDKDFDRALQFTNGFTRLEPRIQLQMQLIDDKVLNGENITNLPISSRQFSKIE